VRSKPVTFSCEETLGLTPDDIVQQILDTTKWSDFKGYAFLPGIKNAEFEVQTPGLVGSRIRVANTDGSSHVEEIIEWQPDERLTLLMKDFSPPLSRLATSFEESWTFTRSGNSTKVVRFFQLRAKSWLTRFALVVISLFLKKAITRHMRQMRDASAGSSQRG